MHYDWERGTLTLPARAWKKFREALSHADQARREQLHALALELYALLVKAYPGIENDYARMLAVFGEPGTPHAALCARLAELNGCSEVLAALRDKRDGRRMAQPTQEDFLGVAAQALRTLPVGECLGQIRLDPERRQVCWSVYWSDRAREAARNSYFGRVLFGLLANVQWAPGTGGIFIGNDEHNRGHDGTDKGRDYVTETFGPLGLGT
jgi:hypothetical protein